MDTRYCHVDARRGWVALNTQPHRERIALESLSHQGFYGYCPLIRKRISHARSTQNVLRPLFPSYLFVQIDPSMQRWRPILSTFGVRTVVRCGELLSFVPDRFIDSLKAREIEGVIVRPTSPFKVGQQVRIADGAFNGLVATIIEMDERDRLVVLTNFLNRSVNVKLSSCQVLWV